MDCLSCKGVWGGVRVYLGSVGGEPEDMVLEPEAFSVGAIGYDAEARGYDSLYHSSVLTQIGILHKFNVRN